MEEVEYKILQTIAEISEKDKYHYVGDDLIAEALNMDLQDVRDYLDVIAEERFVEVIKSVDGSGTMLTHKGRLILRHPDYMQKKGYAVACLNILEEAVTKDTRIPEEEKKSLVQKIRAVSEDPYMVTVGSGLIVEGLKKVIGL